MSLGWQLARRVAFAVFAMYLVVSLSFGFIALTADPNLGRISWQAAGGPPDESTAESRERVEEAIAAYREARNLDEPLLDRYLQWLVDVTTLDWGKSYSQDAPVIDLVAGSLPATLVYVVPAMAFALVGGIGSGLYSAFNQYSALDRLASGFAYLGFSVPNFWIAEVTFLLVAAHLNLGHYAGPNAGRVPSILITVVLPAIVLGTSLLAGQLRYARAESREYVNSEFVKLLRAKGASGWRIARHILRNAALPLLSLFFAELLAVLVINIFVLEQVFGIAGLGQLTFAAIQERDLPLVLGATMVFVFFGIVGNLLQDIAYLVLDPRVDYHQE